MTIIPIVIGGLGTVNKIINIGTRRIGSKRTCGHHLKYSIIKIGQNTEKSPGEFRRTTHSNSFKKPSAKAAMENSQKSNNNDNKRDKYSSLVKELKKLCNIKMKVIQIVIGALVTIPERLVIKMEELNFKTIQTTGLL